MKGISAAIILMTIVAGSAADAAIRCEDAPGREQRGVYWSWREIDGKRCWFIRTSGAMPAKSAFTWVKEEPVEKDVPAAPEKTKTGPTVQMLGVKPDEDLSDVRANWLDDAPVDLTVGEDLRGTFGVGGNWVVPAYAATGPARRPLSRRSPAHASRAVSESDVPQIEGVGTATADGT
jgi:hypothetical protein